MPITLLTEIKLSDQSCFEVLNETDTYVQNSFDKHIVGVYIFPCKDLKENQPVFNDGFPSLIFMPSLKDKVCLSQEGKTLTLKAVWVCSGVIKDTQWNVPDDLDYILVLRFNPSSFYSTFNINPSMFLSTPVCSFEDIVDESWLHVIRQMYKKEQFSEKIAVMKDAVADSMKNNNYLPYLLQSAIDHIDHTKGNTTVSNLLTAIGGSVNQKWLQRNFTKYIGMPPKRYISLQRFIYTFGQYYQDMSSDLLSIAMLCGYYDYNHFLKDFKNYMGIAPSRYNWR